MSKVIKVDDQVYGLLDNLRGKGETFGQVGLKNRCNLFALLGLLEDAPFPAPVSAVIRFFFKARGIFKFKKRPEPFSFKRRPRFIFEG